MSTPLPTTGISGGISETGVATIEVPMFVETLDEALSVLPNLGIGNGWPKPCPCFVTTKGAVVVLSKRFRQRSGRRAGTRL